jgi:lysophospholipase L1-like esterase
MDITGLTFDGQSYRWLGSFDELKNFTAKSLNLSGEWSAPGGDVKLFTGGEHSEFIFKWQKSKRLTIVSDNPDKYIIKRLKASAGVVSKEAAVEVENACDDELLRNESKLDYLANNSSNDSVNNDPYVVHLSRAVEDGFGLADTKLKNIEVKFQSKIDGILNDLNNLKTRSDYGSERFIDVLLEENSKLKKENSVLSERVNDSLFLISDLKTHVKVIESEKQSLITCIKLLHNECNCHEDSSTNVKSPTTERPANDTEVSEQHNSPTNICKNATDQSVIIVNENPDPILSNDEIQVASKSLQRKYKSKSKAKKQELRDPQNHECSPDQPFDPVMSQSPKRYNEPKHVTVVAGDSIIQNLHGWRLSNSENHVVVKSFSGATVNDMEDYLKPVLRKEPNKIILHVGTNDLKSVPANRVAEGIANLGTQIKEESPVTSIVISSILPRSDNADLSAKALEVNRLTKSICSKNKWGFIEHKTVNKSCLNSRGLHLNNKGTSVVAKNISNYISSC